MTKAAPSSPNPYHTSSQLLPTRTNPVELASTNFSRSSAALSRGGLASSKGNRKANGTKKAKKLFSKTTGMTREAFNSRSLNSYGSFDFDMSAVNTRGVETKVRPCPALFLHDQAHRLTPLPPPLPPSPPPPLQAPVYKFGEYVPSFSQSQTSTTIAPPSTNSLPPATTRPQTTPYQYIPAKRKSSMKLSEVRANEW